MNSAGAALAVPDDHRPRNVIVAERRSLSERRLRTAEAALDPASAKQVVQLLQQLCAIYGTPPGWEDACRIYLDVLRQPAAVLAAAVRAHIEQSRWFPKPSELLEICAPLRWPLESELESARADLKWVSDPVEFRTKAQLMAERRELYGEFTSDLDTEWMLWHLGTAPPVPDRATVAAARGELERLRQERQKVEREALRERLAAAINHPQADELAYARAVLDRQLREEWAAKRVPAPAPPARSTPETALIEVVHQRRARRPRPHRRKTR
jgi:hypothetical protein